MKLSVLAACLLAAFPLPARAEDAYPPLGFQRTSTAWCAQGHFLQVVYEQVPGDPAGQCQLWLEPSNAASKPQHLLTYTNRISSFVDDSGDRLAIQHHETNNDDLLYVFFRSHNGTFQRVPTELRAAALQEFCQQTRLKVTRADFDHFGCVPDQWSENGLLIAHLQGDTDDTDRGVRLKPWYFVYDVEHQKFVPQSFPKNKEAFRQDHR